MTHHIFVTCRSQNDTGAKQLVVEDRNNHYQPHLGLGWVPRPMRYPKYDNSSFVQLPRERER